MKLDTEALLQAGSFSCVSKAYDPESDAYVECATRAVFVTEETVTTARAALPKTIGPNTARLPDLRFGDILLSRTWPEGRIERRHVPAGRDAGLLVPIILADGYEHHVPFTGDHMPDAHHHLLALEARGRALDQDQARVLRGIEGVFDIIAARPDPRVFSEELIGKAFLCALLDKVGRVELSISDAEFGRKARADTIRARIAQLTPDHPDSLSASSSATLEEILQDIGVPGRPRDAIALEFLAANPDFAKGVIGALTATSSPRIACERISPVEYDLLADELSGQVLSGKWVDLAVQQAADALRINPERAAADVMVLSTDGLDLMALRSAGGRGTALIYAWPSADRLPLAELGGHRVLAVSPEEIPTDAEIMRLGHVLDAMTADRALENADQNGRLVRMA